MLTHFRTCRPTGRPIFFSSAWTGISSSSELSGCYLLSFKISSLRRPTDDDPAVQKHSKLQRRQMTTERIIMVKEEGSSVHEINNRQNSSNEISLDFLKQEMASFAKQRDWDQYHSPRNLLLALVGEVGELSEIFQWKGEVGRGLPDWNEEEKLHLGEELSDVLLYLVRLSDICGVDLGRAALRKIQLNAIKYPAPAPPPPANNLDEN